MTTRAGDRRSLGFGQPFLSSRPVARTSTFERDFIMTDRNYQRISWLAALVFLTAFWTWVLFGCIR